MTTVCRPNVACKTFLVCGAIRTLPINQVSLPRSAAIRPKTISPLPSHGPTSLNCAKNSHMKTKRSLKISSVDLGCQLIGIISTQQLKTAVAEPASARSYATWRVVRPIHKKLQHFGMSISKLRLHKPNLKIESVQVRITTWLLLEAMARAM